MCCLAVLPVLAQVDGELAAEGEVAVPPEWRGSSTLQIVASDETGAPVPGVALSLRLGESSAVLRGLETDSAGKVEIEGLAAGEWQIDLQREGFMLVTTYVRLEPGEDPVVAFSTRQRTGSFWAPLNAVYLQAGETVTAALKTGRSSPEKARKEAIRQSRQERKEQERLERLQRRGRVARVVPSEPETVREAAAEAAEVAPPPRPEVAETETPPSAPPASAGRRGEAPRTEAQQPEMPAVAAVEISTAERQSADAGPPAAPVEPAEPQAPQEAPEDVATVAAPSAAEADTGAPPVAEARPAAESDRPASRWRLPALLPNPDLLPAGACPECRPGEWSVSVSAQAAPRSGEGACRDESSETVSAVAARIGGRLQPSARRFAGPLRSADGNDVVRLLPPDLRDEVEGALVAALAPSPCPVVAAVIPAGARYIGFRYQAEEAATGGECLLGQDCQIGDSRWLGPPTVTKTETVIVVHAQFDNRSPEKTRSPRLTVYFEPARGWLPPK